MGTTYVVKVTDIKQTATRWPVYSMEVVEVLLEDEVIPTTLPANLSVLPSLKIPAPPKTKRQKIETPGMTPEEKARLKEERRLAAEEHKRQVRELKAEAKLASKIQAIKDLFLFKLGDSTVDPATEIWTECEKKDNSIEIVISARIREDIAPGF